MTDLQLKSLCKRNLGNKLNDAHFVDKIDLRAIVDESNIDSASNSGLLLSAFFTVQLGNDAFVLIPYFCLWNSVKGKKRTVSKLSV